MYVIIRLQHQIQTTSKTVIDKRPSVIKRFNFPIKQTNTKFIIELFHFISILEENTYGKSKGTYYYREIGGKQVCLLLFAHKILK